MELRLIIIAPERVRRRLAGEAIASLPGLRVVAEWASACEAEQTAESPDLFLVNAALFRSEAHELDDLAHANPGVYFVLFGAQPDLNALLNARRLPVRGFLAFNHLADDEFARSLKVIASGGAVIEPTSAQLLLEYLATLPFPSASARLDSALSGREREVLDFVRAGLSNKEIALSLRISLGTVRAHLRSIFRKLDVRSRAGAALPIRLHATEGERTA